VNSETASEKEHADYWRQFDLRAETENGLLTVPHELTKSNREHRCNSSFHFAEANDG